MKKSWNIPLALIASTMLVACGADETADETDQSAESTEATEQSVKENEETTEVEVEEVEAEGEESEEAEEEPEKEPEEEESEDETDNEETAASGEMSEAYTAEQTSETEPVPLGEWGQITSYSTEDSSYHPTYLRITQITAESDDPDYIQSAFEEHNNLAENDFQEVNPEDVDLPADVEWLIVDYEMHYPEDFPAGEFGIQESSSSLTAINPEGGGIPSQDGTSIYLALGIPELLYVDTIETSQAGDTRTSRNVYTMVKDYEDFIFDLLYNLEDGEEFETIYFDSQ